MTLFIRYYFLYPSRRKISQSCGTISMSKNYIVISIYRLYIFSDSLSTQTEGKEKNKWEQTLALIGTFAELPHSLAFAFGRLRILWESPTQISVENSAGSCPLMKKKKSCRLSKISAERTAKNEQHHYIAHHATS